jgi:hypothetical protein
MKLKYKALFAAGVLALSSNAQAITTVNGGELFMVAYDSVGRNTFVATLGAGNITAFLGGTAPTQSFNLTLTGGTWNAFKTAAGANDVKFSVLAIDRTNTRMLVTGGGAFGPSVGANSQFDNVMTSANSGAIRTFGTTDHGTLSGILEYSNVLNSTGTGSGSAVGTNVFGLMGANLNTQDSISAVNATDATANYNPFYLLDGNSNGLSAQVDTSKVGDWWLSQTGTLSYVAVAAVPEADSSLMIMAGLGLIGFIAKRRKSTYF